MNLLILINYLLVFKNKKTFFQVIITGKTLPHSLPGIKYQFITEESEGDVTLCNVEQLVLKYYKTNGYPKGKNAIFVLL